MAFRSTSTRRSTAASAVSSQVVMVNNGTGFTAVGSQVTSTTSISLGVTTVGQTSAATTTTVASGPTIANVQYLDSNNAVIVGDIAVSTAGGNILINGSGFVANSNVYVNNSLVTNTFISSTQIRAICPAASAGNVNLMIFSPTNTGTLTINGVRYSGVPSWTTAAVSFQNGAAGNVSLVASSDSTLTYTLQAGSTLPTGISLVSAGYLSGTATGYGANTTGTIVLIATDQEGQATQQTITWTVAVADPQFNYNTLLLNGDTGNNTANAATNNTFLDSSTNNFTITRAGTATQGTFSPFSATGWSNYFGGSDYLSIPTTGGQLDQTGDFTYELWIYWNSMPTTGYQNVAGQGAAGQSSYGLMVGNTASSTWSAPYVFKLNVANSGDVLNGNTTLVAGQWYHLAHTRTSGVNRLFVNGVVQTNTYTDSTSRGFASNPYLIGQNSNCYISNFRYIKGTSLYTTTFTPPTSPLTAVSNTQLLTCQSNRFKDNSTNSLAVTTSGTPSTQAWSPFAPANSYAPSTNGGSMYCVDTAAYTSVSMGATQAFGTGDFTVECWVYNTASAHNICMAATATTSWELLTYGSQLYWHENGGNLGGGGYGTIILNAWSHFAVSRASGTLRMFINGVQVYSAANTYNYSNNTTVRYIGPANGGTAGQFISDFRVINGTALYTAAFTPTTAPLTAVTNTTLLLSCTNSAIADAHASTDVITVGASLNTTTKKFGTASIFFNGTSDKLTMPASPLWIFGTGDFTVEFWMNTADTGAGLITPATTGAGYWALLINSSTLYWQSAFNVTNLKSASLSGYLNNTWVHIAIVRYSGTMNFYFNGTAQGTGTADSTNYSGATNTLTIGYDNSATNGYYAGYLDDLRITKGFARYTANFTAPTSAFQVQ